MQTGDVVAVKLHPPCPGVHQAAEREVERGLARAVAAQQRHGLAGHHMQVDTAQDFDRTIARLEALHIQQGGHD
ncbi:hypothetical protein D9M68_966840 [compost metagenome]